MALRVLSLLTELHPQPGPRVLNCLPLGPFVISVPFPLK